MSTPSIENVVGAVVAYGDDQQQAGYARGRAECEAEHPPPPPVPVEPEQPVLTSHYVSWTRPAVSYAADVADLLGAGITAALIDIPTPNVANTNTKNSQALAAAAKGTDLQVIPCADANGGGMQTQTVDVTAAGLETVYRASGMQARMHGRLQLASFRAEGKTPAYWRELLDNLARRLGEPVDFIAVFLNASEANLLAYLDVAETMSVWGPARVTTTVNSPDRISWCHQRGKRWMSPVRYQDVRAGNTQYADAENTGLLRLGFDAARGADSVQIISHNDDAETPLRGSVAMQLIKRLGETWKRGHSVPPATDRLYLSTRLWPAASVPAMRPILDGAHTPKENVEVLVSATGPAIVELTVGGATTSVGVGVGDTAIAVPWKPGPCSARLMRRVQQVAAVAGPTLTSTPASDDVSYHLYASK